MTSGSMYQVPRPPWERGVSRSDRGIGVSESSETNPQSSFHSDSSFLKELTEPESRKYYPHSTSHFLGLDVHADTIAVAVAEQDGEVRSDGTIPNRLESVRKMIHKLGPVQHIRACYEAGPTGYVLYWQLTQLGVACEVIAPSLVPTKAGDRVKTDRRDAEKLARCHRAG